MLTTECWKTKDSIKRFRRFENDGKHKKQEKADKGVYVRVRVV